MPLADAAWQRRPLEVPHVRRVLALISALALVLVVAGPVAAQEEQINNIVVTSVTRDAFGGLNLHGTAQCVGVTNGNVQIQGSITQAIGHKTTVNGGLGGGTWCPMYGTIEWDAYATPDYGSGSFSNGWITGWLGFNGAQCDQNGCWPNFGGTQFTFKVTKR